MAAHHHNPKKAKIKLIYPAQQFFSTETPRPDGSLGLLYLAAKLRNNHFDVSLLDMTVGDESDDLTHTFYHREQIDDDHVRVGMPVTTLKRKITGHNIIGVTSIFTPQTYQALEVAKAAKEIDPDILTIAGGGNAKALHSLFLDSGFDMVVCGEGEEAILDIVRAFEAGALLEDIPNTIYKKDGQIVSIPERPVLQDLDQLPYPAWDMLPLNKYWTIGEPHGGTFEPGQEVRYLSMQTSRGCPFRCQYCHISKEGDAAKLRTKSYERVMEEIDRIKSLGAEYLFFEDDSLLAKRERIKEIFRGLQYKGLKIIDVNGVNLSHFFFRDSERQWQIDTELLDLMVDVGWVEIAFPFESGCQRILNQYASKKWRIDCHDVRQLVRESIERGLRVSGFFTIGYPDETYEELTETFVFAKELSQCGLSSVLFFLITPYPGSVLYDQAVERGHLPHELDLVNMKFAVPTMTGTAVPPEVLAYSRRLAFQLINSGERIEHLARNESAVNAHS